MHDHFGTWYVTECGVNDDRDTWTCAWGQTVKATARALQEVQKPICDLL